MCVGGSWNLARGLMEVFIRNGGTFVNQASVDPIVIEGGRATAVELDGGRTLRGRRFVVSTVDVHQTFQSMVGAAQLPADYDAKVAAHHYTPWALYGVHLALREAPRYTSTDFDPNVNRAMKQNIGSETLEQLMGVHKVVQDKQMPTDIQFGAGPLTMIDPTQAPPGMHTAYAWHVVPYDPGGDPANAEQYRDSFGQQIIDKWRQYAPNLTDDNILGSYFYTPNDYVAHLPNMRGGDIFMGSF